MGLGMCGAGAVKVWVGGRYEVGLLDRSWGDSMPGLVVKLPFRNCVSRGTRWCADNLGEPFAVLEPFMVKSCFAEKCFSLPSPQSRISGITTECISPWSQR